MRGRRLPAPPEPAERAQPEPAPRRPPAAPRPRRPPAGGQAELGSAAGQAQTAPGAAEQPPVQDPANPPGVSPQTSQEVESSPAATTPPQGDGKFKERGLGKPATLEQLKGLTKVFGEAVKEIAEQKSLTPKAIEKIMGFASKVLEITNQEKFKKLLDKAFKFWKANGKKLGKVLEKLKKWLGGKDPKQKDEPGGGGKPGESGPGAGQSQAEEDAAGGGAATAAGQCKRWQPIPNLDLPHVLPYQVHEVTAQDTLQSLAQRAQMSEQEFLRASFGSGVSNRRLLRNRTSPQPGDRVMLPRKGPVTIKLLAQLSGFPEGTPVKLHVYRQYREHGQPLATLEGKTNAGGRVAVDWNFTYDKDKHGEKPQFIYKIEVDAAGRKLLLTANQSIGVPDNWGPVHTPPRIVSAAWSKTQAKAGEKVELQVTTEGVPDGSPVVVELYRLPKGEPEPPPAGQHFFEAVFKDLDGKPLPAGTRYELELPDRSKLEGRLDAQGRIFHDGIKQPGNCNVVLFVGEAPGHAPGGSRRSEGQPA